MNGKKGASLSPARTGSYHTHDKKEEDKKVLKLQTDLASLK